MGLKRKTVTANEQRVSSDRLEERLGSKKKIGRKWNHRKKKIVRTKLRTDMI